MIGTFGLDKQIYKIIGNLQYSWDIQITIGDKLTIAMN